MRKPVDKALDAIKTATLDALANVPCTQTQMAHLMGCDKATISRFLSGERELNKPPHWGKRTLESLEAMRDQYEALAGPLRDALARYEEATR